MSMTMTKRIGYTTWVLTAVLAAASAYGQPCDNCATGEAKGDGAVVKLCNIVVTSTTDLVDSTSSKNFHAQDASGGVTIFGSNAAIDALLAQCGEGDEISLIGTNDFFNNLYELTAPFTFVQKHGSPGVPAPIPVSGEDFKDGSQTAETLESKLVVLKCVKFTGSGTFAGLTNYTVTDCDGKPVTVRVSTRYLDIVGKAIPTQRVNITGIFSQFSSGDPSKGYQLLPRKWADIVLDPNCCQQAKGACCFGTSCQQLTRDECLAQQGSYVGDGVPCDPNPCGCDGVAVARAGGTGKNVRLCRVQLINDVDLINSGSSKSLQVQDPNGGAALTIFGPNADIDAILGNVVPGDLFTLRGLTGEFNGLFQLQVPFTFESNDGGGPPFVVKTVTSLDLADNSPTGESYESQWVTIRCARFADAGGTFVGVQNYAVTDPLGGFTFRVSTNDLDLVGKTIPTGPVQITGIFSQFDQDPNNGLDDGYQILGVRYADIKPEDPNNCGEVTGACCIQGQCQGGYTKSRCEQAGGEYLGDGTTCNGPTCPVDVIGGDIAFGLSNAIKTRTLEHIRAATKIGSWPSRPYIQSVEFDNSGAAHAECGNLIGANFGAGGGGGAPPTCTDPNRPDEAGKLYNFATNGTNKSEKIYDFNSLAGGIECTRIGGVGISPDNKYISVFGYDTLNLYILNYNPGPTPGTGTGASITGARVYNQLGGSTGTQGTAWLSNNVVLTYNTDFVPGVTTLHAIRVDPNNFVELGVLDIPVTKSGGSMFTDVEYNAAVSPYIFALFSNFAGGESTTVLTAIDPRVDPNNPANWLIVKTLDISAVVQTGRELALGPDGNLYISQYSSVIDRISVANPGGWDPNQVADYYTSPEFAAFDGLDVAFQCPVQGGACCTQGVCAVKTRQACLDGGGYYRGDGTKCDPDPCICRGDANCDGVRNFADINPFVEALGGKQPCRFENVDVNEDNELNFADINPFVEQIGKDCP